VLAAIRRAARAASAPTARFSMAAPTIGSTRMTKFSSSPWRETREAVKNLDEIVSVEGLDGVYVGPSDLSLSMGKTPTLDPQDPEVLAAIKAICAGTRKRGKIAGVHTDGAKTAIRRFGEGYQLCTILSDARLMANAAAAAVREARGQMAQAGAKTY
jgi:4-hydroxy-2-oxoheptanedioate aldolase